MGGRRVTESPPQAQGLSISQSRQAGTIAAAVEARSRLQSRQSTATPSSSGSELSGSGARPYRRAQSFLALHPEPENAEITEFAQPLAKRIKLDPDSGFNGLPWLAPGQNAERRALHRRLTDSRQRPEALSKTEAELDDTVGLVSRFEREVLRADELLSGVRTKLLSEAEWRELTYLVERARSNLPLYRANVPERLKRLVEGDALSSDEAALLEGSLQRLIEAHEYLCSEELPWRGRCQARGTAVGGGCRNDCRGRKPRHTRHGVRGMPCARLLLGRKRSRGRYSPLRTCSLSGANHVDRRDEPASVLRFAPGLHRHFGAPRRKGVV